MKKAVKRAINAIKASKGDTVQYRGKNWTVSAREYDPDRSQSFYLLTIGRGSKQMSKWARSDQFATV